MFAQPQNWRLPLERVPFPPEHAKDRIKHFARLLLEGAVSPCQLLLHTFLGSSSGLRAAGAICPALKDFRPFLSAKPSALLLPATSARVSRH